ncbi:MAG: hypothetical protein IPI30_09215 [Saprospiraceae bacterium]|nr:hypothetical protein [Candidatus Vicinibacter affinis]
MTAGLRQRTSPPTIFEYLRRHAGFSATECWSIGQGYGFPDHCLNYSAHQDYGREGMEAILLAPLITSGAPGSEHFMDFKNYHPDTTTKCSGKFGASLNKNFSNEGWRFLTSTIPTQKRKTVFANSSGPLLKK